MLLNILKIITNYNYQLIIISGIILITISFIMGSPRKPFGVNMLRVLWGSMSKWRFLRGGLIGLLAISIIRRSWKVLCLKMCWSPLKIFIKLNPSSKAHLTGSPSLRSSRLLAGLLKICHLFRWTRSSSHHIHPSPLSGRYSPRRALSMSWRRCQSNRQWAKLAC